MKTFKLMAIALVAMLGFTACDKETDHIYDDHSADLAGTWTCLTENYAEALIINADGTAVSYGVEDGEYWENVRGTVVTEGGKIIMTFEDDDNCTGHFDIIPGMAFSLYEDNGERYTYHYCEHDLSDEVIGMWVCTDKNNGVENNMAIQTFSENGKSIYTGFGEMDGGNVVKKESNYKVVGDLSFQEINGKYIPWKMTYSENGTSLGDIMTFTTYASDEDKLVSESWLRIKQHLELEGQAYAYKSAYVSNANGKDEEFSMMGHTFNMANIGAADFDVLFCADLYLVELNGNSITHKFRPNGQEVEVVTPITIEGNKITLDYSAVNSACREVVMYMFQDQDNTQLHMYMPTSSFVNYFANLGIPEEIASGRIDQNNAANIEKFYEDMEARIKSINVSFVLKSIK